MAKPSTSEGKFHDVVLLGMRISIFWRTLFSFRQNMRDRKYGTNIFAGHTRDITHLVDGNRVKLTNKPSRLWTHRHTCAAVDAGIPVEVEDDGGVFHEEF